MNINWCLRKCLLLFDQSCDELQRKYNDKGYVSEKNHRPEVCLKGDCKF